MSNLLEKANADDDDIMWTNVHACMHQGEENFFLGKEHIIQKVLIVVFASQQGYFSRLKNSFKFSKI